MRARLGEDRWSSPHRSPHTEVAPPYHNFFLDRYTPAYRAEMDHFVTAIETGTVPFPGFTDGRAALVLADAANESLRTGTTAKVVGT
jgi:myo-inositol 2-dehydrogenase/D-chiro-inositol 1-dehydrogenase